MSRWEHGLVTKDSRFRVQGLLGQVLMIDGDECDFSMHGLSFLPSVICSAVWF